MESLRSPLAVFLCCTLCAPAPLGYSQQTPAPQNQPSPGAAERPAYQSSQLHGDQRILHALNRFTFGPRPGDLEAVRAMGLDNWFDQQLHPASINQTAQTGLDRRLAPFLAMQWDTQALLFRLPGNAVIRQAMNGKIPVPEGGALHAIYENQIFRLEQKKAEQNQKSAPGQDKQEQVSNGRTMNPQAPNGTAMNAAPGMAENAPSMGSDTSPSAMTPSMAPSGQMDTSAAESAGQPAFDQASISDLLALPPQQRVAQLAAMQPAGFESFIKSLRPAQRSALNAGLSPGLKLTVAALENPEREVAEELVAQRLTRDIYSCAQLQEVMTDFWLNHFNVYLRKNEQMPYYLVGYERDTIRPRSLGKFEDLLEAVAHSPAMLVYLDNAESIGPDSLAALRADRAAVLRPGAKKNVHQGLNENYARELMELHTLGVNGGYTQADVTQVARVLTGWTVDRPLVDGQFTFNPNRHEPGSKKVLGKKIKDNGENEGRELLHMLATRPATAQFISRKLALRFVSDDPPQSLVDRMAKSYMSSGGDIAVVLKTLFHSPEFWSAAVYRAKVKTPLEFVVSAVRAGNMNIDNLLPLANALRQMGMPLYGAIPPTGYDWKSSTWVSTGALVARMNFALNLAANRLPGITASWTQQPDLAGSAPEPESPTPQSEEARLESLLVPGGVSISTRSAALQQFQAQFAQDAASVRPVSSLRRSDRTLPASALERQDQLLAGLLLGSPEFQRR